jgi:hypothetical protein
MFSKPAGEMPSLLLSFLLLSSDMKCASLPTFLVSFWGPFHTFNKASLAALILQNIAAMGLESYRVSSLLGSESTLNFTRFLHWIEPDPQTCEDTGRRIEKEDATSKVTRLKEIATNAEIFMILWNVFVNEDERNRRAKMYVERSQHDWGKCLG